MACLTMVRVLLVCLCSLPPHNDIIGAQFSPDKSHVALRVSDKEVKVLSTATGEVVTARSCRGTRYDTCGALATMGEYGRGHPVNQLTFFSFSFTLSLPSLSALAW